MGALQVWYIFNEIQAPIVINCCIPLPESSLLLTHAQVDDLVDMRYFRLT